MKDRPEAELIDDCRRGDQGAIGELFERHYASSLHLARGILRSEGDSQDAVQTAYLSAFQHLDRFRGEASFKTWITRIVLNCCLMRIRAAGYRLRYVQLDEVEGARGSGVLASVQPTPEKSAWCREIALAHSQAVADLPHYQREAYLLSMDSGLSLKEIAARLNVTLPAAKTRVFRARAGMRQLLEPVWKGGKHGGTRARTAGYRRASAH